MSVTVRKISVAIGQDELAWAQSRAKRDGTSVSAVLTNAARAARDAEAQRRRQRKAWAAFLSWATDGEGLADEDLDAGARELGLHK